MSRRKNPSSTSNAVTVGELIDEYESLSRATDEPMGYEAKQPLLRAWHATRERLGRAIRFYGGVTYRGKVFEAHPAIGSGWSISSTEIPPVDAAEAALPDLGRANP